MKQIYSFVVYTVRVEGIKTEAKSEESNGTREQKADSSL